MQTEKVKFNTVYADPPWSRNQQGKFGAAQHYETMSLEDIKNMPVKDLAADNAHLWLWVPNGIIEDGLKVMKAWGFEYRCSFYWVKPKLGLGTYLRNASETCLFGVRGKAPVKFKAQPNWQFWPVQEHSAKPHEMYAIIERLSPGPYLELFARKRTHSNAGWSIWGNEAEGGSDIVIPGYPVPEYSELAKKKPEDSTLKEGV